MSSPSTKKTTTHCPRINLCFLKEGKQGNHNLVVEENMKSSQTGPERMAEDNCPVSKPFKKQTFGSDEDTSVENVVENLGVGCG